MTLPQVVAVLGPRRGKKIGTEEDLIAYLMRVRRSQLLSFVSAIEEANEAQKQKALAASTKKRGHLVNKILHPLRKEKMTLAQVVALLGTKRSKDIRNEEDLVDYLAKVRRSQLLAFVFAIEEANEKGSEP